MSQPSQDVASATDQSPESDEGLSPAELNQHQAADLPEREAMSLIKPGLGLVELGGTLDPYSQLPGFEPTDPTSADTSTADFGSVEAP